MFPLTKAVLEIPFLKIEVKMPTNPDPTNIEPSDKSMRERQNSKVGRKLTLAQEQQCNSK